MKHLSIDGFAGGGGASCGLKMAGIDVTIAINHDPAAIRMHTVNHPKTLHLTEDIFQVDLSKYIEKDDCVDVMWASRRITSSTMMPKEIRIPSKNRSQRSETALCRSWLQPLQKRIWRQNDSQ